MPDTIAYTSDSLLKTVSQQPTKNISVEVKKILLLWSPLADYSLSSFRKLAEKKDIELYMIYQAGESNAPYNLFDLGFFKRALAYKKENEKELEDFCMSLNPDVIMMSSWNYKFYMAIAKKSKRNGSKVISTFDGQWRGTLKQRLGVLSSPFFLKPAIDNFFVPGDRQANFARKLGYKNPLLGYYSASTDRFKNVKPSLDAKKFLFVGRLVAIKGVEYLINAYKEYRSSVIDPWELIIVGKGELSAICNNVEGIKVKEFIQPQDLPAVFAEATCFILPSFFEPWGVVIHEAVTSGLSVISSYECGAATAFVRDGQNGYIINTDQPSLVSAMKKMSAKTQTELEEMSATSRALASLWTTEKWGEYVYQNICLPVK
ncbi:MAG: glycosyltransferase family 4 protein [Chitinophagaceae bacterium]